LADCLETLEEINQEAREAFLHAGGETFHYIPCLNDGPQGLAALTELALSHLSGWPVSAAEGEALGASRQRALAMGAKD
jgi:ferrochelatase